LLEEEKKRKLVLLGSRGGSSWQVRVRVRDRGRIRARVRVGQAVFWPTKQGSCLSGKEVGVCLTYEEVVVVGVGGTGGVCIKSIKSVRCGSGSGSLKSGC
jgi:hypothetical protein